MKLYYHKTDGGAEYLMDTFIEVTEGKYKGHREGTWNEQTRYVVRIDGDITKDAELSDKDNALECIKDCNECHYSPCTKHDVI